jgi:hypothetical protein
VIPQDVIVILELPEAAVSALREFVSGILFERFDERHGVAAVFRADGEDVNVVRHHAIRVNEKIPSVCVLAEAGYEPLRDAWVSAEAAAMVETQRNEIDLASEITGR